MNYSFKADNFRDSFHRSIDGYLAVVDGDSKSNVLHSPKNMVAAMEQAIDVMERTDAEQAVKKSLSDDGKGLLEEKEITEIGGYTLELLEGLVSLAQGQHETMDGSSKKTDLQRRDLMRLSIPVSLWIARQGGRLKQIDMVVNSLAGYANELNESTMLSELASVMGEIVQASSDDIKLDFEQTNPMRPWRILNLNYGIVATRSHEPDLIETAYDALVENLPQDARGFFREGMTQMDVIGYPQEVRDVVERYDNMWGSENTLH